MAESLEDGLLNLNIHDVLQEWKRDQEFIRSKIICEDSEQWMTERKQWTNDYSSGSSEEYLAEYGSSLRYVGGFDISFVKNDLVNACATFVVTQLPDMEVVYEDSVHIELLTPYIPGFLAFREASYLIQQVEKLKDVSSEILPQVIFVDGNGILHPNECGLACHLGVLMDIPCIGVAKSLFFIDQLEKPIEEYKLLCKMINTENHVFLKAKSGKVLGAMFHNGENTLKPLFVSVGHKVSLETALWIVGLCSRYRIPEPIRQADIRSRTFLAKLFPDPLLNTPKKQVKKKKSPDYQPQMQRKETTTKAKDNSADVSDIYMDIAHIFK